MKNWIRVTLVIAVLIGGTSFFSYQSFSQFNSALDNLSASYIAIANSPQIPFSDKTNKGETSTTTPDGVSTTTPDMISAIATSTDLRLSLVLPNKNNEVYIGCTYQLSLQSSTTIQSLETALVDGGTREVSGPIASGLAKEYKIAPGSQSLDWKVGVVWPGDYFISASKINGTEKETMSKYFKIHKMPEGISAGERENICKESGGLL